MRHLLTILAAMLFCAAPAQAQTMKALMYNTTNGQVAYSGTNGLRFVESVAFSSDVLGFSFEAASGSNYTQVTPDGVDFSGAAQRATTRTNLSLGATWLTNTNVTNFRSAIGLGATNTVTFDAVFASGYFEVGSDSNTVNIDQSLGIQFGTANLAAQTRTNLGLGATDSVQFADVLASGFETLFGEIQITDDAITSKANIVITNQTAANNGLLFIYRTNREAFLGLANLIASNNTTVSNETLFRVGVAEATNRSAQFGFRATNTNGNGVAVFSVFGFNALMQIGADASTNAVIYSGGGTNNEVMTLIRDGATEFARPLRFSTNASTRPSTNAPANTNNVAAWVEMRIGTNSYRVPLYQ